MHTVINNLCHFWYSQYWKEYQENGKNEKIHEILIVITRCSVIVIASCIATALKLTWAVFTVSVLEVYASYGVAVIGNCIVALLLVADNLTYVLSVYFVYNFGYDHYRKLCNFCHIKMYKYFQSRHQKQVENGAFDGEKYQQINKQNKCCCCINSKNESVRNQNNVDHIINHKNKTSTINKQDNIVNSPVASIQLI